MKNKILLYTILPFFYCTFLKAQTLNPQFTYIRPSNTGLGGDYFQCIRIDECGNKWSGGYLPFWSEGSVVRFDDSVFTCWSNFEGYLPADRVYDLAFDQNGGLWVASNGVGNGIAHGGVSHYDGTTWQNWTTANSPLPEDDMRGITVDYNNNIWATFLNVGNGAGGVAKYDGSNWTIYTPGNSGLQSGQCDKIVSDAQNNIWIGTNLGLVKFDGLNWILYTTQNSGISNNDITDVEYDATTGKIYVAAGIAIDIFDGTSWSHINSNNAPISGTGLWAVDARGDSLIIATIGGSYLTYIYDGTTWINHQEPDHTYDARIDKDGNFWTCGIGVLSKYDGNTWTNYGSKNTGLTGMFNNDVFVDSRNRAWFGSSDNGGINMFDCPKWQEYNPYNGGLWQQPVTYTGYGTGITEDSFGDIWMVFNGVAGAAVQVTGGDVDNAAAWHVWDNANSGVSLQFMSRCAGDKSGNVWFGYDGACSVTRYNHATNSWTNFNLYQLGQITCGAGSGIKSIRVDDSNNVWVCGLAGLAKYDQTNWTFYSFLNTPMLQGFVNDIAFDTAGNKWIATEHGLYKFDGTNWTTYTDSTSGMIGNYVYCVTVADDGYIWLGCTNPDLFPAPSGLCSFDGTAWTQYTTTNSGLPEKTIERMTKDTLGNIWLMTPTHGAAIFNHNNVTGYQCLDKTMQPCSATSLPESVIGEMTANVYPNPVNGWFKLSYHLKHSEKPDIIIIDVLGKTIKKISAVNGSAGLNELKIDLAELKTGIYFCKIKSTEGIQTIKLIKN